MFFFSWFFFHSLFFCEAVKKIHRHNQESSSQESLLAGQELEMDYSQLLTVLAFFLFKLKYNYFYIVMFYAKSHEQERKSVYCVCGF